MSNGKKLKKMIYKYRENQAIEEAEEKAGKEIVHPVHGFFLYECEGCGAVFEMYLDKGLEDHVQDKIFPERHKPVPYTFDCKVCRKALARHIIWGIGESDEYEELPKNASYFANVEDDKYRCGKPIVRKYFQNIDVWREHYKHKQYLKMVGIAE